MNLRNNEGIASNRVSTIEWPPEIDTPAINDKHGVQCGK
jgi:hypothetical protein